jgi:hypothetical protein
MMAVLTPAERVERAMDRLCELVCENGPTHLLRGMPSYHAHEAMVRCIERIVRQRNELETALEDLVELCDDGPDLSQSGPDPVVLVRAKDALEHLYGPETEEPEAGPDESPSDDTPEPPRAA